MIKLKLFTFLLLSFLSACVVQESGIENEGTGKKSANASDFLTSNEVAKISVKVNGLKDGKFLRFKTDQNIEYSLSGDGEVNILENYGLGDIFSIELDPLSLSNQCAVVGNSAIEVKDISKTIHIFVNCIGESYQIGGKVKGLIGEMELALNSIEKIKISKNGKFKFKNKIPRGFPYLVKFLKTPLAQKCILKKAHKNKASQNVTNIDIVCKKRDASLSGSIDGLITGNNIVLTLNNSDEFTLNERGVFLFEHDLEIGSRVDLKVKTQPVGQTCGVFNGNGRILTKSGVENIRISCQTNEYAVSGTYSGHPSGSLILELDDFINPPTDITISSNGTFTFDQKISYKSEFQVRVKKSPNATSFCSLANNTGVMGSSEYLALSVDCSGTGGKITATVSGLGRPSDNLKLKLNNNEIIEWTSDGAKIFQVTSEVGVNYNIEVISNSNWLNCGTVYSGAVAGAENVAITCVDKEYNLVFDVKGLDQRNHLSKITISSNSGVDTLIREPKNRLIKISNSNFVRGFRPTLQLSEIGYDCELKMLENTFLEDDLRGELDCEIKKYRTKFVVNGLSNNKFFDLRNNDNNHVFRVNGKVSSPLNFTGPGIIKHGSTFHFFISKQPSGQYCKFNDLTKSYSPNYLTDTDVVMEIDCATANVSIGGDFTDDDGFDDSNTLGSQKVKLELIKKIGQSYFEVIETKYFGAEDFLASSSWAFNTLVADDADFLVRISHPDPTNYQCEFTEGHAFVSGVPGPMTRSYLGVGSSEGSGSDNRYISADDIDFICKRKNFDAVVNVIYTPEFITALANSGNYFNIFLNIIDSKKPANNWQLDLSETNTFSSTMLADFGASPVAITLLATGLADKDKIYHDTNWDIEITANISDPLDANCTVTSTSDSGVVTDDLEVNILCDSRTAQFGGKIYGYFGHSLEVCFLIEAGGGGGDEDCTSDPADATFESVDMRDIATPTSEYGVWSFRSNTAFKVGTSFDEYRAIISSGSGSYVCNFGGETGRTDEISGTYEALPENKVFTAGVNGLDIICVNEQESVFPTLGDSGDGAYNMWNYYVQTNDTDSECSDQAGFQSCIHVGELRSITTKYRSCENLFAYDYTSTDITGASGIFNWYCVINENGYAQFNSKLRDEKGLSDLIDNTDADFEDLHVAVLKKHNDDDYIRVQRSASGDWWNDNIIEITNNQSSVYEMKVSDTIYYIRNNIFEHNGFYLSGDRISFVLDETFELQADDGQAQWPLNNCTVDGLVNTGGASNLNCNVFGNGLNYSWIEGEIKIFDNDLSTNKDEVNYGLYLVDSNYNKIVDLKIYSDEVVTNSLHINGIYLNGSDKNHFRNVDISNVSEYGLKLDNNSSKNFFEKIVISNVYENSGGVTTNGALSIESNSNENRFQYLNIANSYYNGLIIDDSNKNIFTFFNSVGTMTGSGISIRDDSEENQFAAFSIAHADNFGLYLQNTNDNIFLNGYFYAINDSRIYSSSYVSNNLFQNVGMDDIDLGIGNYNVEVYSSGVPLIFKGDFLVDTNNRSCYASGTNQGITDDCDFIGQSDSTATIISIDSSTDVYMQTYDEDYSYDYILPGVGSGTVDYGDLENGTIDLIDVFGNSFQKQMTLFASEDNPESCSDNDCVTLSLVTELDHTINKIRRVTEDPSETSCPSDVGGEKYIEYNSASLDVKFLDFAVEIIGDRDEGFSLIGDDDGLCEDGESCIFAPNLGKYQGHDESLEELSSESIRNLDVGSICSLGSEICENNSYEDMLSCPFSDNTDVDSDSITGVKLFYYDNFGL